MKRVTTLEVIALNIYWLGLAFMWNSLHVIILPAVLLLYVPETQKNTYLGLMTFAGLVIAMVVQPISGAVSDRWTSRWGKRRPLILLGTAFDFLFLGILAWAGGILWLAIGYLGLQVSSNIAHGPAQGLLPDRVPAAQMGRASGVKILLDMGGTVISSLLVGRLLSPQATNAFTPIVVIMALMLACLLTTLLGVREIATHDAPRVEVNQVPAEPTAVVPVWQVRSFWWLVGSRLVFLMGIYGIQAFAQYYVRDVLRPPNPAQLTGDLLAAITLALIVFAIGGGRLGDSIGHKNVLVMASAISAIGYLLLVGVRTPSTLLVFGSVLGAGIGLFLTSNWALANRLAPTVEAGKYMGLTNLATAGAGALARLGGPLIDIGNNAQPGAFIGYTGLFLFGTICAIFSAFLLRWVTLGTSPAGTQALSQSSFEDPV